MQVWEWKENAVVVKEGSYHPKNFYVEGDWSAASYYYAIAALSKTAFITLKGLSQNSVQGDSIIAKIAALLLVDSKFNQQDNSVVLEKEANCLADSLFFDYLECPDLAQTVIALLGALNIEGEFKGLQTLKIKETDRVEAMSTEMAKFGVRFEALSKAFWKLTFEENFKPLFEPRIATYEDHRMAMAIAPLCLKFGTLVIEEPDVVTKSYPKFWDDLESLGFKIEY